MADTGWKSAASSSESNTNATWTGTSNIYTDNGVTATVATSSNNATTELTLSGFSFGIPTGSTIDGIEISVDGAITNYADFMDVVGVMSGNIYPLTNGSTIETKVYGGPTDKWGTSFTASDIDTMQVVLTHGSVSFFGGNGFAAEYDAVLVKVYYTPPSGGSATTNTFFWSIV